MKKLTIFIFILLSSFDSISQSKADDLIFQASDLNKKEFIFGEPFYINFELINTSSKYIPLYLPNEGVNYTLELENLDTGLEIKDWMEDLYRQMGQGQRERYLNTPPTQERSIKPNQQFIFWKEMWRHFGSERLDDELFVGEVVFMKKLAAVPVGRYRLTIKYELLPSEQLMTASHEFEVKPVPAEEKVALDDYVNTLVYAAKSCQRHKFVYVSSHPHSFENFLEKHPNSVYAPYAYLDMISEVYLWKSDREDYKQKYLEEYLTFPDVFKNNNGLKYQYAFMAPNVLFKKAVIETVSPNLRSSGATDSAADNFLKRLSKEDPAISDAFIRSAKRKGIIKGKAVKNYARESKDEK